MGFWIEEILKNGRVCVLVKNTYGVRVTCQIMNVNVKVALRSPQAVFHSNARMVGMKQFAIDSIPCTTCTCLVVEGKPGS